MEICNLMSDYQNDIIGYRSHKNSYQKSATPITMDRALADQTIQEIRDLAFEYVKQIVAAANELSQAQRGDNQHQIGGDFGKCFQNGFHPSQHSDHKFIRAQDQKLISEAASQINQNFYLDSSISRPDADTRPFSSSLKKNGRSTRALPSVRTSDESNNVVVDYIEQDCATMSSSPENSFRASDMRRTEWDRQRRRFRDFRQRINWHMLVSCFSSCLPETLVETSARPGSGISNPAAL